MESEKPNLLEKGPSANKKPILIQVGEVESGSNVACGKFRRHALKNSIVIGSLK
jgi:hypothetical protein